MLTTLVVDASVATKWFPDESGSEAARTLLYDGSLIAPDVIVSETYHAVWKRWRRGEARLEQVEAVVPRLRRVVAHFEPIVELALDASRLSLRLSHPIYDCLYLVLAQRTSAVLSTADERQFELARRLRVAAQLV